MKYRRRKKRIVSVEEFDITSLLDILVILLVFLLKSFNESDLSLDLVNELSIPYSMSRVAASDGVIIQVNKVRNVFVDTDIIGNLNDDDIIEKVQANLNTKYKYEKEKKANIKKLIINLVFDKTIRYGDINKIMDVSSKAGYSKYKLIIQGEE